ncbi:conserved hypothetical protein [Carnobacterium maltaromaticum]|nr:conserved hypothetical protein [Carnobacterium maltaromaticum]
MTGIVNFLFFRLIYFKQTDELNLSISLITLACNYLTLYILFTIFYRLEIKNIVHKKF